MPSFLLTSSLLRFFSAFQIVTCFNIESTSWRHFSQPVEGFGYRVIQHNESSLLVSAPLEQYSENRRGQLYQCQNSLSSCSPIEMNVPPEGVNMSLGLTMSKTEPSTKTVVCGPTTPKECDSITQYGGMCFSIGPSLQQDGPPTTLEECKPTDIAFLLDGSGSVHSDQFTTMKTFVKKIIRKLLNQNTLFALTQYSHIFRSEVNFNEFLRTGWESQVDSIRQIQLGTYTARGISNVVNNVFDSSAGAREDANRILIVITDGKSSDSGDYPAVTAQADRKHIVRYAIGVGGAFDDDSARSELESIASSPVSAHMFKVGSFEALEQIGDTLEKSIIAIEGVQSTGDSTTMEFAQNGFSAALVSYPEERFLVGVVGANGWRGGYQDIPLSARDKHSFKRVEQVTPDSYLGYSMAVASRDEEWYIVLGAPRYKHKGLLMVFFPGSMPPQKFTQPQIGSYFGAEVCVVDLDGDSNTDLILASAPMHTKGNREGKVFVYKFTKQYSRAIVSETSKSLLGMEGQRGRFGSSLASLADLNGDGIRDVAVGAPLEDNGQGSVYIFNGRRGGIKPTYSQRISGSSVRSGLRFFGLTVAQSALDQSGDGLPDIAVGSNGAVLLLRSRPVVSIVTRVNFDPRQIPTSISNCTDSLSITASVCFHMKKANENIFKDLQAELNYTLKLDYKHQHSRAHFMPDETEKNFVSQISLQENCFQHPFFVKCLPNDIVSPVDVQVTFSFEGVPIKTANLLVPQLDTRSGQVTDQGANQGQVTSKSKLKFRIDCGKDKVCEDNLRVDFNFSGSPLIMLGITREINVTVMVENRGENSYDTEVSLSYPYGLFYRTLIKNQGRVECHSIDSTDEDIQGRTECSINKPILMAGNEVTFIVQYGIEADTDFEDDFEVKIQASASSDNDEHAPDSLLNKTQSIGIKYSIYLILNRFEDTTNFINFTAYKNHLEKPVIQIIEVTNSLRGLNLTVVINVPVRLQGKDIWTNVGSLNIQGCTRGRESNPIITDLQQYFMDNKEPEVNCTVAVCLEFRCTSHMIRNDQTLYNISGNVSSGWIEKTGLRSATFHLVSSATLEYDNSRYIYYSSDSSHLPPVLKVETLVEVYEVLTLTKEISYGIIGGLLLLILMTVALIKMGFFESDYQKKLQEAKETQGGDASEEAECPCTNMHAAE